MNYVAVKFVDYLIENHITSPDMREQYIYGFEVLFGKILNYGTLLLLAWLNGNVIQTLLFMATFLPLRSRTGGYHAKTSLRCYFGTLLIYVGVSEAAVPLLISYTGLAPWILAGCVLTVFLFAPVNHPNLDLDMGEMEQCRIASRRMVVYLSVCVLILEWLQIIPEYTAYLIAGIGLDAGLLLIAKIIKQEVQKE